MRKLVTILLFLIPSCALGQTSAFNGWCDLGATTAALSGMQSTNQLQGDVPLCTVTVYVTNTTNKATLYSDPASDPLSNPFTASTKGQWLFWSSSSVCVDVVLSGGVAPNNYQAPVTITGLCAGGGGANSLGPNYGFFNSVATTQASGDTVLALNSSVASYPPTGIVNVGSEYEQYNGVNTGTNTLTNITRGISLTTPATHTSGTDVFSVDLPFGNYTQLPSGGVFGVSAVGFQGQILSVNCGFPTAYTDIGKVNTFQVNCGNATTFIDTGGGIHQVALGATKNFLGPLYIGVNYVDTTANIGQPIPITLTTNVAQTNGAYQFGQPMGFSSGISGPVISNSVPNIPAPTLNGILGGTCSMTYEVTGVDVDGATVPGTPATITGLVAFGSPTNGLVDVQTPLVAGIVTYTVYRTAISGACGGIAAGRFIASSTAQYPLFGDTGQTGDSTSPPSSNTSVAKSCTNGEAFCELAGAGSSPTVACSSGTRSWMWHNTSATSSPFALVCNGSSWVTAF
jgi:hypothetical protein